MPRLPRGAGFLGEPAAGVNRFSLNQGESQPFNNGKSFRIVTDNLVSCTLREFLAVVEFDSLSPNRHSSPKGSTLARGRQLAPSFGLPGARPACFLYHLESIHLQFSICRSNRRYIKYRRSAAKSGQSASSPNRLRSGVHDSAGYRGTPGDGPHHAPMIPQALLTPLGHAGIN